MCKNRKSELQNSLKLLKNHLNTIFFLFMNVSKNFYEYVRMENLEYKIENIEENT